MTPEEIIGICEKWDPDGGYWYGFGKTVTPAQLLEAFQDLFMQAHTNVETLKAFQEAANERESALHRELALARAGR